MAASQIGADGERWFSAEIPFQPSSGSRLNDEGRLRASGRIVLPTQTQGIIAGFVPVSCGTGSDDETEADFASGAGNF